MNRIEIEELGSQAALAAFTRAWRQQRAGRKATPRLAFGSIAELFSAVSEKRLELARHVAGEEGQMIKIADSRGNWQGSSEWDAPTTFPADGRRP